MFKCTLPLVATSFLVLKSELPSFLCMEPREQIGSAMPYFCMGRPGASDAPGAMSTQALLAGRVVVAICVDPAEHIGFSLNLGRQ